MRSHPDHSDANPPDGRRDGRGRQRELTAAFRRYVDAVQDRSRPSVEADVEAALDLAEEMMGHRRGAAVDAALAETYGASMRELATAVRQAGRGAMAHPALFARAVVLARTLESAGAGRRAARRQRDLAVLATTTR